LRRRIRKERRKEGRKSKCGIEGKYRNRIN
jgi:hypothetical protein